ncbi:MAG: hypothetical protein NTX87_10525, partial [Planctomycetota bacterium]|nr:hypothetical protein [Planctomycetota bacterium]
GGRGIGFDAIDLKMCHGYLINELLAAHLREGPYGGPLENRTRLARNALARIREATGGGLLLAVRLNAFDGVPFRRNPQTAAFPHRRRPAARLAPPPDGRHRL